MARALNSAVVAICIGATPVSAQFIAGRILGDSSRQPLPRVTVSLLDSASQRVVDSVMTDTAGVFLVSGPTAGAYRLRFDRPGAISRFTPTWRLTSGEYREATFLIAEGLLSTAYLDTDVDEPAMGDPKNAPPTYPQTLRDRKVEGNVLIQFIVDTTGRMVTGSLRILSSTAPEFGDAARAVAEGWQFLPARRDGVPVREIVCMPLSFRVSDKARALDAELFSWIARRGCPR